MPDSVPKKVKAKGRKASAKPVGIPIPHAALPIAAPRAASSHVIARATSAKAAMAKHKSAAPTPPLPGPDMYDLASQQGEGEEEEYGDQGWFEDDPEVDIDLFGDTRPKATILGAGSFLVGTPNSADAILQPKFRRALPAVLQTLCRSLLLNLMNGTLCLLLLILT